MTCSSRVAATHSTRTASDCMSGKVPKFKESNGYLSRPQLTLKNSSVAVLQTKQPDRMSLDKCGTKLHRSFRLS